MKQGSQAIKIFLSAVFLAFHMPVHTYAIARTVNFKGDGGLFSIVPLDVADKPINNFAYVLVGDKRNPAILSKVQKSVSVYYSFSMENGQQCEALKEIAADSDQKGIIIKIAPATKSVLVQLAPAATTTAENLGRVLIAKEFTQDNFEGAHTTTNYAIAPQCITYEAAPVNPKITAL